MGVILTACHWWIVAVWMAFAGYWIVAALIMKRGPGLRSFRGGMRMRLMMIVVVVIAVELARRATFLRSLQLAIYRSVPMALSGAIIATIGAAVAFSARAAMAGNWAPPATERTNTELVTSGPYALVRHPIYTGVLLMMIGTALGLVLTWALVAVASGTYFFVSARAEERYMAERFSDKYAEYRERTKMLIPFVL